jgi:hypothetical protein
MHAVARVDGRSMSIAAKATWMCRNKNWTKGVKSECKYFANVKNLQVQKNMSTMSAFAKPIVHRSKKQAAKLGPNCRMIKDYFHLVPTELPPTWLQPSLAPPAGAR